MPTVLDTCDHTECRGYDVDEMFNERVPCRCWCHLTWRERLAGWLRRHLC